MLDRFRGHGYLVPWRKFAHSLHVSRARNVSLRRRVVLTARVASIALRLFPKRLPPHSDRHLYVFIDAVLMRPHVPGVLVEAGAFKGISAAKISLAAELADRILYVFDSFEGLPYNEEPHDRSILGHSVEGWFEGGQFAGSLDEVKANVARFGRPGRVQYVEGWFDETMPMFDAPIAAAYLDVDLASSTITCLESLWPLMSPGGVLVSQDGDFPLVIEAIRDWADSVDPEPVIEGLGVSKMVTIMRPVRRP